MPNAKTPDSLALVRSGLSEVVLGSKLIIISQRPSWARSVSACRDGNAEKAWAECRRALGAVGVPVVLDAAPHAAVASATHRSVKRVAVRYWLAYFVAMLPAILSRSSVGTPLTPSAVIPWTESNK
jgi:hypothetical protein